MHPRSKTCLAIFTGILVSIVLPASVVMVVDPYQIYHKSFITGVGISIEQRYQNAGVIHSYFADPGEGYDSVLIGTSMSGNFTRDKAAEAFGWKKPLRLFLGGGMPYEQLVTLKYTLSTGHVAHVLWELNPEYYESLTKPASISDAIFPEYLYNNDYRDDSKYIFNFDTLVMSWKMILGKKVESFGYTIDNVALFGVDAGEKERMNSKTWIEENAVKNTVPLLPECLSGKKDDCLTKEEIDAKIPWDLEHVVLPFLRQYCNRDIDFVLFTPPLPRYRHVGETGYKPLYMPRYILDAIGHCANMRFHSFDTMDFTGDLNNYADGRHAIPEVNEKILMLMGAGKNRITLENVGDFEKKLIDQINHYTLYTTYPAEPTF